MQILRRAQDDKSYGTNLGEGTLEAAHTTRSFPVERTGIEMTNSTVLIADMAILVGIFLLGFLAKTFPKSGRNAGSKQ